MGAIVTNRVIRLWDVSCKINVVEKYKKDQTCLSWSKEEYQVFMLFNQDMHT